jgi:hypothetical protein
MPQPSQGWAKTDDGVDLPYVDTPDGQRRWLAVLPTPKDHLSKKSATWTQFAGQVGIPTIPLKDVEPFDRVHTSVPILDQNGKGACVLAGTLVRMADGSVKPVEDVRCLDKVLTAEGRVGWVSRTMARHTDGGLICLYLWGHGHLRLTPEHPVLTRRGYVPVGQLRLDDYVAIPRFTGVGRSSVMTGDHIDRGRPLVSTDRQLRTMSVEGRKAIKPVVRAVPEVIGMNRGLGRILGMFLAEGCTWKSKIEWTFARHERETLVAELDQLLRDELGLDPVVSQRGNGVWKVKVYGQAWAELIESLCGSGVDSKRLHPDLASGNREFVEALFAGWFDGDGSYKSAGRLIGTSVSHQLAMGMFDIANGIGYRPTVLLQFPKQTGGGAKSRRPTWRVVMAKNLEKSATDEGDNYRSEQTDTHVWRKVRGIEHCDYVGHVHNLEVEGDHSYVVEGIGVHNCVAHAFASAAMIARSMSGAPYVPLSAWFLYSMINGGHDGGAIGGDAVEVLQKHGICPFNLVPYGTIKPAGYSDEARKAATRFMLLNYVQIKTFEEAVNAAYYGWGIGFDVRVAGQFETDKHGAPPFSRGQNNHEVFAGEEYVILPDGRRAIGGRNSWSEKWGVDGRCYWTEDHINYSDTCFAIQYMIEDPEDAEMPPELADVVVAPPFPFETQLPPLV